MNVVVLPTLALAASMLTGGGVSPDGILADRLDDASSASVLTRLEALARVHPGERPWGEAVLRARSFVADGLLDPEAALRLHAANIDEGLARLAAAMDVELTDFGALARACSRIPREAVGLAHWTAGSFARTIPHRPLLARPGAARQLGRVLRRLVELDPTYFRGAPLRSLALYDLRVPGLLGGSDRRAVRWARRAMELDPGFAPNRLVWAEVERGARGEEARARGMLERAVASAPHLPADDRPEHLRARDQALRILERMR
jgi:hypothetical protein